MKSIWYFVLLCCILVGPRLVRAEDEEEEITCMDSMMFVINCYTNPEYCSSEAGRTEALKYIAPSFWYTQRHFGWADGREDGMDMGLGQANPRVLNITRYELNCTKDKADNDNVLLKCKGRGMYDAIKIDRSRGSGNITDWYQARCNNNGKLIEFDTSTEDLDGWGYRTLGLDASDPYTEGNITQGICAINVTLCSGIATTDPAFLPAFGVCMYAWSTSGVRLGNLTTTHLDTKLCRSFYSNLVVHRPERWCPMLSLDPTPGRCDDANVDRDYSASPRTYSTIHKVAVRPY